MILNLGMASIMSVSTTTTTASTATPMIQPIDKFVRATMIMPPMPRIGAYSTMRMSMMDIIWICCTSLVARVIRDAAEKRCTSASENDMTFAYSELRRPRPILAPVREATSPTSEAMIAESSTNPIIFKPVTSR